MDVISDLIYHTKQCHVLPCIVHGIKLSVWLSITSLVMINRHNIHRQRLRVQNAENFVTKTMFKIIFKMMNVCMKKVTVLVY